jgi:hypothetical protein
VEGLLARDGPPQQQPADDREHGGEEREARADHSEHREDQPDDGDDAKPAGGQHEAVRPLLALPAGEAGAGRALDIGHTTDDGSPRALAPTVPGWTATGSLRG